ncbi:MAG TPA: DUF3090 family protein [Candidatus Dormibacteraeota bacterium]
MGRNFELDPVDELAVAAVGEPGQRRFFLLAGGAGERATLACEKFHIQGLVARIQQLLETQGLGSAFDPTPARKTPEVQGEDWTIGELGLGYHESRKLFVIVAREQVPEGEETDDAATARFWAGADRVRAFSRQAEQVLSSGRPVCTYCGLPMDPAGHPCPASNGSRPIF